jgi:hypothetical protein
MRTPPPPLPYQLPSQAGMSMGAAQAGAGLDMMPWPLPPVSSCHLHANHAPSQSVSYSNLLPFAQQARCAGTHHTGTVHMNPHETQGGGNRALNHMLACADYGSSGDCESFVKPLQHSTRTVAAAPLGDGSSRYDNETRDAYRQPFSSSLHAMHGHFAATGSRADSHTASATLSCPSPLSNVLASLGLDEPGPALLPLPPPSVLQFCSPTEASNHQLPSLTALSSSIQSSLYQSDGSAARSLPLHLPGAHEPDFPPPNFGTSYADSASHPFFRKRRRVPFARIYRRMQLLYLNLLMRPSPCPHLAFHM